MLELWNDEGGFIVDLVYAIMHQTTFLFFINSRILSQFSGLKSVLGYRDTPRFVSQPAATTNGNAASTQKEALHTVRQSLSTVVVLMNRSMLQKSVPFSFG